MASVCEKCFSDLLYCDVHDADYCPTCDAWLSPGCSDPECSYCPGRAAAPSLCGHGVDRHYRIYG